MTTETAPRIVQTGCPLDCPDTCSLDVTVENERVAKIDGTRAHPYTAGFICSKVRKFDQHVYGDERVLYPSIRVGPKGSNSFRRATWDEALDRVEAEMRASVKRSGGAGILPLCYGGSNGSLSQDLFDKRLFARIGASELLRTVCAVPSGTAARGLYGGMPGVALGDYTHARVIVVWGMNPQASGIHLVPVIKAAREQGAKLIVIDPRRTPLARGADLHLAPRPGTDLPLALGLIRAMFDRGTANLEFLNEYATGTDELRTRSAQWSFEQVADVTGVPVSDLETFYDLYVSNNPAVIRCGWGLERNRNGGSAVAAVLALPAIAGKFGVRGGGYTMSMGSSWTDLLPADWNAKLPAPPRSINMNLTGVALTETSDPKVDCLFVYNANPLATLPNQELVRRGLEREDLFTVVYEQVWTDTAKYADVVLPATTFLEHWDLRAGYGSPALFLTQPAIAPVGEARPNDEVFAELCTRLDLHAPGEPTDRASVLASFERHNPELYRSLQDGAPALPWDAEAGAPLAFVDYGPRTSNGKIQLVPAALDSEAPKGLYGYQGDPATREHPLTLISPAMSGAISSTLAQLIPSPVALDMHPTDAAARSLATGERVRISNEYGAVVTTLNVTEDVVPGTVVLPKGLWSQHTESGTTSNALSPDTLTDLGGGACFNDARVAVERAAPQVAG